MKLFNYYVVYGKSDFLPQKPRLKMFYNFEMNIKDELGNKIFMPIINSGSRIGAYDISREIVFGSRDDLALPKGVNKITLFFLPEKTMQKYDWKQIYDGQLYEIKVILTGSELKSKCWRYTYIPPDTLNINN